MNEWRPIATAPKNGTDVLITDGHYYAVACWDFDEWRDIGDMGWGGQVGADPTHWMPLPPLPETMSDDINFEGWGPCPICDTETNMKIGVWVCQKCGLQMFLDEAYDEDTGDEPTFTVVNREHYDKLKAQYLAAEKDSQS